MAINKMTTLSTIFNNSCVKGWGLGVADKAKFLMEARITQLALGAVALGYFVSIDLFVLPVILFVGGVYTCITINGWDNWNQNATVLVRVPRDTSETWAAAPAG